MKRRVLFSMLLCLMTVLGASAQWAIGMRDSKFAFEEYTHKSGFGARLEESILAEKASSQHLRLYLGWKKEAERQAFGVDAYYGLGLNGRYSTAGVMARAQYFPLKRLSVYGALNPHYDSGYNLKCCYRAGMMVMVSQQIGIRADFNTIPVYRLDEKRLRFGAAFAVEGLWLSPMITMPVEGGQKYKSMRVEVTFRYVFADAPRQI